MIRFVHPVKVWACTTPTNMSASYDRLLALAQQGLGRSPLAGDLFLFVNRKRRQCKTLYWDGNGLCILAKRLEQGHFAAPWEGSRRQPWQLTVGEFYLFLEGNQLLSHVVLSPSADRV